jgi:uncharacterized membrane protein
MNGSESSIDTEGRREARFQAAPAVVVAIALQLLLSLLSRSNDWELWVLPWWSWLVLIVPELALALYLLRGEDPHQLPLVAVMFVLNLVMLTVVIGSIVEGQEKSGGQLLLKGVTVWLTNVTAFALTFWELEYRTRDPEFQFPQMEKDPSWRARFFDYFYVSFTNSIAFSPTDAMPLTRRAKLLMLAESSVSAIAILLVAARAVNIFK